MAFSNYLGTTLLCTTLFYGFGFGLYGHLSRAELVLVIVAIWALMLLWSKPDISSKQCCSVQRDVKAPT